MTTDDTTDPPLDAAQRLGLARFRAKPLSLPWLSDALRDGCDEVARLTRERDAARAALRDALRCDECGATATRMWAGAPDGGAAIACDAHGVAHGVGDGWRDLPHAAAVRAARVP